LANKLQNILNKKKILDENFHKFQCYITTYSGMLTHACSIFVMMVTSLTNLLTSTATSGEEHSSVKWYGEQSRFRGCCSAETDSCLLQRKWSPESSKTDRESKLSSLTLTCMYKKTYVSVCIREHAYLYVNIMLHLPVLRYYITHTCMYILYYMYLYYITLTCT